MSIRTISLATARRVAITRQRLAGPRPPAGPAGILDLVRDLGCLQLDPTNAVARSHLLVLWSRLGLYDVADLATVTWERRQLFEDWAHAASLVLMEDYPIFSALKRQWATSPSAAKMTAWMEENAELQQHILKELAANGPLPSRRFRDLAVTDWHSDGWNKGRNVDRMLAGLWAHGRVMVAGRSGGQKLWDLAERCVPEWAPHEALDPAEVESRAVEKAMRALGVARPVHIRQHFLRGTYPTLDATLASLEAEGRIVPLRVVGEAERAVKPGPWYVHSADLPLVDTVEEAWQPRTTLLSPFDNLICDRKRTEEIFGFRFRLEIYTPPGKRQFGFFVLPILHGDRLIGRVDPVLDRRGRRLVVNAIYDEPGAPLSVDTRRAVGSALEDLAVFLGAHEVVCGERVPKAWQASLQEDHR
jgi:uncharacterized protein